MQDGGRAIKESEAGQRQRGKMCVRDDRLQFSWGLESTGRQVASDEGGQRVACGGCKGKGRGQQQGKGRRAREPAKDEGRRR